MSMGPEHQVAIKPVIQYPYKAHVGQSYLMVVDLQMTTNYKEWPYEDEEYPVRFILDTMPLFNHRSLGEPLVVLHRFGGTYGPAQFLLTAVKTPQKGKIRITLVNLWGKPIMYIPLECEIQTDVVSVSKRQRSPIQKRYHSNLLSTKELNKAINRYYEELARYYDTVNYELAVRAAFQNLLADTAHLVKWTLRAEQTIEGNIRPDGVLRDTFAFRRGFWEAKGPKSDLEKEIQKKIADGYPLINTVFENSRKAILYQNKRRLPIEYDLTNPNDMRDLLSQFLTYTEPDIENFETAVDEFKERIPELAKAVFAIIEREYKLNKRFVVAFNTFAEFCRTFLNPQISTEMINEMLIQHLLTERLFSTVFNNPDFIRRNIFAVKIEKVIEVLASRSFNRKDFLKTLDRFYVAIEGAAKGIESWSERQHFFSSVYERFFQSFSVMQADAYRTVYTPQEIVDFMYASVDKVLTLEFGTSIETPGVQILDPASGTGSFITHLLRHISRPHLKYKYQHDLFCNEIMLLPYYITSLNIEHEYYDRMSEYEPFEGICFTDTLELTEGSQQSLFVEENIERVQREKDAQIMVVIGNTPYNVGRKNDNSKKHKYVVIEERIRETYVKDSRATLKAHLYDTYVRFFRWATDRLRGRDGIVCFVSNNSFIDQIAFDGMRKHLLQDFTQVYHLDLHGNIRNNPKLSGKTHNVLGIQVGIGITIAVRSARSTKRGFYYYRVPDLWTREEKLAFLAKSRSISEITWMELQPDERYNWITEDLHPEFASFPLLGTKAAKALQNEEVAAIFRLYGGGVKTNRDVWTYAFNRDTLEEKIRKFIETYNNDAYRWQQHSNNKASIDEFVIYDETKIKWSADLKMHVINGRFATYSPHNIRQSLYRPFSKKYLYFDSLLNNSTYLQPLFFPTPSSELENLVICVPGNGNRRDFGCLAANLIANMDLAFEKVQCFPYYTYSDGGNRHENITDWALKQFQDRYGKHVTKWNIFHFVYAILHHPQYRERYVENLKRDLPHVPLVKSQDAFTHVVLIGEQLIDLHLNYERVSEYPLQWMENESVPFSWRVEKMRLTSDRTSVIVNESLTLTGIPQECFQYRLGNRSALEWVIDQYQVTQDKRSGIESDPNNIDVEEYIVRLIGKVVTVSVETLHLIDELVQVVTIEDWIEEKESTVNETG